MSSRAVVRTSIFAPVADPLCSMRGGRSHGEPLNGEKNIPNRGEARCACAMSGSKAR
jgi:hypothetical protein